MTYRLNSILIKIPMTFFKEIEKKNDPKMYMEPQKPKKAILRKNKARDITYPDFKLY